MGEALSTGEAAVGASHRTALRSQVEQGVNCSSVEFLGQRMNSLPNCGWPGVEVWVPGRLKLQGATTGVGVTKTGISILPPPASQGGPLQDSEHGQASFPPLQSGVNACRAGGWQGWSWVVTRPRSQKVCRERC